MRKLQSDEKKKVKRGQTETLMEHWWMWKCIGGGEHSSEMPDEYEQILRWP